MLYRPTGKKTLLHISANFKLSKVLIKILPAYSKRLRNMDENFKYLVTGDQL